jgi:hypothetical protein
MTPIPAVAILMGANRIRRETMPRLDSKCDVIGRIVGIERGPVPQMEL